MKAKRIILRELYSLRASVSSLLPALPIVLALTLILLNSASTVTAQVVCNDSTPPGGAYTVTVCITQPDDASQVSGGVPVSTSITFTGASPGIAKVLFYLNQDYLLTDVAAPYNFVLPSNTFVDGNYTLDAVAILRDGFQSTNTRIAMTFANGVTTPPVNGNSFVPHTKQPAAGQPLILGASGDGAGGRPEAAAIADLAASWNPDLFLYLGDVYEKGTYTEFYNWYGTDTTFFGRLRALTNPVIGNHEYENGVAPGYFYYWDNVPDFYSYDSGGWHFIALNSTSQLNGLQPGTPQYDWLAADLDASAATCTIAYFHHPVYSVGPQGDTPELAHVWQLLAQHGVDIALTGHDHHYQRWEPLDGNGLPAAAGITQFVIGGGGHGVTPFVRTDARMIKGFDTLLDGLGALRLELNADGAAFNYVNISGVSRDSGVIPCSGAPQDLTPPTTPGTPVATTGDGNLVTLNWAGATDNTGLLGYTIYRDGAPISSVSGSTPTYKDVSAQLNTTYVYTIDAFDLAGNHSPVSEPTAVTTPPSMTLVFSPVADSYVNDGNPTMNYGASALLRTDAVPALRSYLRFDLQGVNDIVTQATLRVFARSQSPAGYMLYDVADNGWSETALTYQNAPPPGAPIGASGRFSAGIWTTIDLTDRITGNGPLSVVMLATNDTAISYDSREGAQSPQLLVEITSSLPTPTSTPTWTPTPTSTPLPTETATPTLLPTATPTPILPAGGVVTFTAVADTYVNSTHPDTNYGNNLALRSDASPDIRSYLRFNLQGLAPHIINAQLRVYANSSSPSGYQIYSVADNAWSEATLTYNNAPPFASLVGGSGSFPGSDWTTVDVTSMVMGDGELSLALVATDSRAVSYSSREGSNPPQLIVESDSSFLPSPTPTADLTSTPTPAPPTPTPTPMSTPTPTPPSPAAFSFVAAEDAYVDQSLPNANYGLSTQLRVDGSPVVRSYLRFAVQGVSGQVSSAWLRVYANSRGVAGYDVYAGPNEWGETTLTFANAPALGPWLAAAAPFEAGMWTEVDLTPYVTGNGIITLVLSGTHSTAVGFSSRQGSNPPVLYVETIP